VLFKRTKRKREKAHEASWRKWLKPALVFVSGFVPLAKLLLRKPYVVAAWWCLGPMMIFIHMLQKQRWQLLYGTVLAAFYYIYIVCCLNSVFHFIVPGTVDNQSSMCCLYKSLGSPILRFYPLFASHDALLVKRALMIKFGGH
jgi:hypothetical protein